MTQRMTDLESRIDSLGKKLEALLDYLSQDSDEQALNKTAPCLTCSSEQNIN